MKAQLARWVSILFDSSVLSLGVFPLVGWTAAGWRGIGWAVVALLILTGIPLVYIQVGMRRGWVSDWELTRRGERPRFIAVSFASDVLALLVLGWGNAPHILWVLALVYAGLGLTMFTISSMWKISLHMVGVSGFSTLLVFVFGAGAWWTFLSLPLVAWARLERKKHTLAQLIAGAVDGILITAGILLLTAR